MLTVDEHPFLELRAFTTHFDSPIGELSSGSAVAMLFALDAEAPLQRDETVRKTVRDLLRHGGYKPTGRGKPASEYLVRVAERGTLGAINVAVDACNVVSLHSGLPISVVDLDRTKTPLRVGLAAADAQYVFNAADQTIKLGGLLCLHDAEGPCANAVKDSHRTKTHDGTRRTLSVIWGHRDLEPRVERAAAWYRSLLEGAGARTEGV